MPDKISSRALPGFSGPASSGATSFSTAPAVATYSAEDYDTPDESMPPAFQMFDRVPLRIEIESGLDGMPRLRFLV